MHFMNMVQNIKHDPMTSFRINSNPKNEKSTDEDRKNNRQSYRSGTCVYPNDKCRCMCNKHHATAMTNGVSIRCDIVCDDVVVVVVVIL